MSETVNVFPNVARTDTANTFSTGAQSLAAATSLLVPTSAGYAPTADGSLGFDSTQDSWKAGGSGITGGIPRLLYVTAPAADTLTAATINTTETQFTATWQIPANYLIPDKVLRVTYILQHIATATIPTSQLRLRLGAVGITGNIGYQAVIAIAQAATATAQGQSITFLIVGNAAPGAAANVITNPIAAITSFTSTIPRNAIAQPVTYATNGALNINLTLTYSSNAASNTTQLLIMMVEELN